VSYNDNCGYPPSKARLPSALLFELLTPHPAAQRLLALHCAKRDTKTLKDFLYFTDQPHEAAALAALEGCVPIIAVIISSSIVVVVVVVVVLMV